MSEYFKKVLSFMRVWSFAVFLMILVVLIWLIGGIFLTHDYFDSTFFDTFKTLDKDGVLTFTSVVLAILIPLFILFLETMKKSGDVYKVVLPEITKFRELIFVLLACVFVVLISPRNAFLYAPTLMIVAASIFAAVQALDVVFRIESYKDSIRKAVVRWVRGAFDELLKDRLAANNTRKWTSSIGGVTSSMLWGLDNQSANIIEAGRTGYLRKIRKLPFIVSLKFLKFKDEDLNIHINTLFGNMFDKSDNIIHISATKPYPRIFNWLFKKSIKITGKSSRLEELEKVLDDFESRVANGVEADDRKQTLAAVTLYRPVTDELDTLVKDRMTERDVNYGLNETMKDIRGGIFRDGLSKVQNSILEILLNPLERAIKGSKYESAAVIISEVYGGWNDSLGKRRFSQTARNEYVMLTVLRYFIFEGLLPNSLTVDQERILDYILVRVKEGTSYLAYRTRTDTDDIIESESLNDTLSSRVDSLRQLSLDTYVNEKSQIYKTIASSLIDILEKDQGYVYRRKKMTDYVALNIFMMLAVLKHRNDMDSEYAQPVLKHIKRWTDEYLLMVAMKSVDDDLAGVWNMDMLGMPTDGMMYSVPSYDLIIKELWVELMLSRNLPYSDPESFETNSSYETTSFFTNGASDDKNVDILNIINVKPDGPKKEKLIEVVKKFIAIRRSHDINTVASRSLSKNKIERYAQSTNEGFISESMLIQLFSGKNIILDNSEAKLDYMAISVNTVFDKEMFMKGKWHIGYSVDYQGKDMGTEIAKGSNNSVLSSLLENPLTESDWDSYISKIRSIDKESYVFINKAYDYEFRQKISSTFTSESTYDSQFIEGLNQATPLIRINVPSIPSGMYVVSKEDVGTLNIKKPENYDYIDVQVAAFSEDDKMMEGLLDAKPAWLQEKGNAEAQRQYLLTKVRLNVGLIFKYQPKEGKKIYLYPMEDLEEES